MTNTMELDMDQLEMVNGGFGWSDVGHYVDKVTDYIPLVNHGKNLVKEMSQIHNDKNAGAFEMIGKTLFSAAKCVTLSTLDIAGFGVATAVQGGVELANAFIYED